MESEVRMEGLTLTVKDVQRSIKYYTKIGFSLEWDATPQFALLRIGGTGGATLGLLHWDAAKEEGAIEMNAFQSRAIHVELSTDDLDTLHKILMAKGVKIKVPPHDEPWERSMTAFDPDGYSVEFSQGRRGAAQHKN